MAKHNFKTQKGILAHCAEKGCQVIRVAGIDDAYVGQPATYHINGDAYATEVKTVTRGKDGLVTGVNGFVVKVMPNCRSIGGGQWFHDADLAPTGKGSGWLEIGASYTKTDPSF